METLAQSRAINNVVLSCCVCVVLVFSAFDCREPIPERYQPFFALGFSEQAERIRDYPLDQQVQLYLLVTNRIHPPNLGLASEIAKNKKRAIPYILTALKNEVSEPSQAHLMYILHWMAQDEDLSKETDLINVMQYKIDKMELVEWKSRAQSYLIEVLRSGK